MDTEKQKTTKKLKKDLELLEINSGEEMAANRVMRGVVVAAKGLNGLY